MDWNSHPHKTMSTIEMKVYARTEKGKWDQVGDTIAKEWTGSPSREKFDYEKLMVLVNELSANFARDGDGCVRDRDGYVREGVVDVQIRENRASTDLANKEDTVLCFVFAFTSKGPVPLFMNRTPEMVECFKKLLMAVWKTSIPDVMPIPDLAFVLHKLDMASMTGIPEMMKLQAISMFIVSDWSSSLRVIKESNPARITFETDATLSVRDMYYILRLMEHGNSEDLMFGIRAPNISCRTLERYHDRSTFVDMSGKKYLWSNVGFTPGPVCGFTSRDAPISEGVVHVDEGGNLKEMLTSTKCHGLVLATKRDIDEAEEILKTNKPSPHLKEVILGHPCESAAMFARIIGASTICVVGAVQTRFDSSNNFEGKRCKGHICLGDTIGVPIL